MYPQLRREMSMDHGWRRSQISYRVDEVRKQGLCPTCLDLAQGGVYAPGLDRAFFEDKNVVCVLEAFPRVSGHSIIIVKPHHEDISDLPMDLSTAVLEVLHAAVAALKSRLGAAKVYVCTMCDGNPNHFHWQLLPRHPHEQDVGSKRFVRSRGVLDAPWAIVDDLRKEMRRLLARHGETDAVGTSG